MQVVTDLHLHSKYSRAVSPQMTLPAMAQIAQQKGIQLLSASDFTHPQWFKEISLLLEESGNGVYTLKKQMTNEKLQIDPNKPLTHFLLSTEIACIYKHNDKLRRIHNLIFSPSMAIAEKITAALLKKGANLSADGRPIIGMSSRNLLELLLDIDERTFLIPCHVWTPHFGVYGSASGYDSLQEAFEDLTPYIYGIETGLSSDPDMNWSLEELQNRSILSFSDAHSAPKMGREASVFELENISYTNLKKAIMRPFVLANSTKRKEIAASPRSVDMNVAPRNDNTDNKLLYTIEFYPEEGKYHYSGHRNCKVSFGPEEIKDKGNICPVCKRKLTEGVLFRVQQLANETLSHRLTVKNEAGMQWFTDTKNEQPPYVKLVPLLEIVAKGMRSTVASQKVQKMFELLISKCGTEFDILLKAPVTEITKVSGERIAEGIAKVRAGTIVIEPGYDGEYGKVAIWPEGEKETPTGTDKSQLSLGF